MPVMPVLFPAAAGTAGATGCGPCVLPRLANSDSGTGASNFLFGRCGARASRLSSASARGGGWGIGCITELPLCEKMLVAAGGLGDFTAAFAHVRADPDGAVTLHAADAALLGLKPGDRFLAVGR